MCRYHIDGFTMRYQLPQLFNLLDSRHRTMLQEVLMNAASPTQVQARIVQWAARLDYRVQRQVFNWLNTAILQSCDNLRTGNRAVKTQNYNVQLAWQRLQQLAESPVMTFPQLMIDVQLIYMQLLPVFRTELSEIFNQVYGYPIFEFYDSMNSGTNNLFGQNGFFRSSLISGNGLSQVAATPDEQVELLREGLQPGGMGQYLRGFMRGGMGNMRAGFGWANYLPGGRIAGIGGGVDAASRLDAISAGLGRQGVPPGVGEGLPLAREPGISELGLGLGLGRGGGFGMGPGAMGPGMGPGMNRMMDPSMRGLQNMIGFGYRRFMEPEMPMPGSFNAFFNQMYPFARGQRPFGAAMDPMIAGGMAGGLNEFAGPGWNPMRGLQSMYGFGYQRFMPGNPFDYYHNNFNGFMHDMYPMSMGFGMGGMGMGPGGMGLGMGGFEGMGPGGMFPEYNGARMYSPYAGGIGMGMGMGRGRMFDENAFGRGRFGGMGDPMFGLNRFLGYGYQRYANPMMGMGGMGMGFGGGRIGNFYDNYYGIPFSKRTHEAEPEDEKQTAEDKATANIDELIKNLGIGTERVTPVIKDNFYDQ
uniref:DUF148 domain-containing protein n=1 Tax=Panagrellus redivivus TaxID=6233 RepID=A0A7E5A143_PANRE